MQTMTRPTHPEPQPLGPKKTLFVMIIVVGCIAILWPKVFYPAMTGNPQKTSAIKDHRGTGCCDVVLDTDEFSNTSITYNNGTFGPQNFRKKVNVYTGEISIRQERPPHLRPDGIHPAMRERGRAIPIIPSVPITGDRPHRVPPIPPKIIDGRPPPIPGMRPPMGAGSHQQPANRNNSMGFIMPLYTIGIVAFFIYTIMKLVCKRTPVTPYNEVKPDPKFREQVFAATENEPAYIKRPDDGTTKLAWKDHDAIVAAVQGIIEAADQHIQKHRVDDKTIIDQTSTKTKDTTNEEEQQPDLKQNDERVEEVKEEEEEKESKKGKIEVLGIEVTATCEGGKKWSRPSSPFVMPHVGHRHHVDEVDREELEPIVLDTPVVPESQILVADTDTVAEEFIDEALNGSPEDPAVILSGRMTLSLISPHIPTAEKVEKFEDTNSDEIISNGKGMHVEVDNVVLMERLLQNNNSDNENE